MTDSFVLAWTTTTAEHEGFCWVMVRDSQRGWELPGGKLEEGESIDEGALRELFEETGLLGIAKAYDSSIVEDGHVVWVEVVDVPSPNSWQSNDPRIEEVGWCMQIPQDVGWGSKEIENLLNHDWSASKTLGS